MKSYIFYFLFLFIIGCSSTSKKQEETNQGVTTDNVFFSNKNPQISVNISKKFSYFGHLHEKKYFQYTNGNGGSYHNIDSYYFIESKEDKKISKIITFETKNINFGQYTQDANAWMDIKINQETLNHFGEYYQSATTTSKFACNDMKKNLFISKGYILPNLFIIRTTSRVFGYNNQYLFRICYAEKIDVDKINLNNAIPSENETLYLNSFSKRASNDISFSSINSIKSSKLQLIDLNHNEAQKTFNKNRKHEKCTKIEACANLIKDVMANNLFINQNKPIKTNPVFRIHLDEIGTVQHIELIKSSNDPDFDKAATDAIQNSSPFSELTGLPSNIYDKYFKTITITFDPSYT